MAGLTVAAFVALVGFTAVLLLVGRGSRRGTARRGKMPADRVVHIPPYGTLQRDTPLPQAAFQVPPSSLPGASPYVAAHAGQHGHGAFSYGGLPFHPSTELSARAFAKMGHEAEHDSPDADPELFIEILDEGDDVAPLTFAPPFAPVSVPVDAPSRPRADAVRAAADKSAPHPLGIIPAGSSAMQAAPLRAASFADLDIDDGVTDIAETYFDEPPQPDAPKPRTDPPKPRVVALAAPSFATSAPSPSPATRTVPSVRG